MDGCTRVWLSELTREIFIALDRSLMLCGLIVSSFPARVCARTFVSPSVRVMGWLGPDADY